MQTAQNPLAGVHTLLQRTIVYKYTLGSPVTLGTYQPSDRSQATHIARSIHAKLFTGSFMGRYIILAFFGDYFISVLFVFVVLESLSSVPLSPYPAPKPPPSSFHCACVMNPSPILGTSWALSGAGG